MQQQLREVPKEATATTTITYAQVTCVPAAAAVLHLRSVVTPGFRVRFYISSTEVTYEAR